MTVTQAVSDPPRTPGSAPLTVHPDRLFPSEPAPTRTSAIADLYALVRDHPIISPHGHVDPRMLVDDEPFADPTSLLLQPDHYVTRLLHANGVSLDRPGGRQGAAGRGVRHGRPGGCCAATGRCSAEHRCGTGSTRSWADIFGVTERPSADNADRLYDQIAAPAGRSRPSGRETC